MPRRARSLELVRSNQGSRAGSLLAVIDRTVTSAGARELAGRLTAPLTDAGAINARLDAVGLFRRTPAAPIAVARGDEGVAGHRPRPVAPVAPPRRSARSRRGAGRDLRRRASSPRCSTSDAEALGLPTELSGALVRLSAAPPELEQELARALADELPINKSDGGFVQAGFDADLDEQRKLRDGSRQVIAGLQARYADATGIKSLKVRHNNVLGYFVEVTATHAASISNAPHAQTFIHRQTLANVMRFTTEELAALEARITAAADRALALRARDLRASLPKACSLSERLLSEAGAALAELDAHAALAELAVEQRYVRPLIDSAHRLVIEERAASDRRADAGKGG